MNKPIRTVVLELLREGDPHNQLLSPFTRYLGRCGNSTTGVVTVPYEHKEFLFLQYQLRYQGGTQADSYHREQVLEKTGKEMGSLLGSVPGFISTLNGGRDELIHLELDLWPDEVALLPFELARMPKNTPGAQKFWLALQTRVPVTITRRLRGQTGEGVVWPRRPRVLFVWSDAGGDVPHEEHFHAIRHALMPWKYPDPEAESSAGRGKDQEPSTLEDTELDELLIVKGQADLRTVQDAILDGNYTHVHILAHGYSSPDGYNFGELVLGTKRRKDIVDGARLVTALCPITKIASERPCVVTLASCDSGAVDSILEPGGSLAHFLHLGGIPLVFSSQFPLSKRGSIWMTKEIYAGLFAGMDPRLLLHYTRERLFALHGADVHDWASVLCYAALPPDLDSQLEEVKMIRTSMIIDARIKSLDASLATSKKPSEFIEKFKQIQQRVKEYPLEGAFSGEGIGNSASAHKRLAEVHFRLAGKASDDPNLKQCIKDLGKASQLYWKATQIFLTPQEKSAQRIATLHWVLTQRLCLQEVLGRRFDADLWTIAMVSARMDDQAQKGEVWPLGSVAELQLLRVGASRDDSVTGDDAVATAQEFVARLPDTDCFEVESTARQIRRYVTWWGSDKFAAGLGAGGARRQKRWRRKGGLLETAERMLGVFGGD